MSAINLDGIAKAIHGLADIFGKVAESIERAILAGLRSGDSLRRARELKRLRNLMVLSANLYAVQRGLSSSLGDWLQADDGADRETMADWETVKFEIAKVVRLLDSIDKYLLPGGDLLAIKHRGHYLKFLDQIAARRRILEYIYEMDYLEAVRQKKKLAQIAAAYVQLTTALQSLAQEFGTHLVDEEALWTKANSAKRLETLPHGRARNAKGESETKAVTKTAHAKKKPARKKLPARP